MGELALGRNVLVAFMIWGGYNFEDSILVTNAEAVDFGRILANTTSTVQFAFRNPGVAPVSVRSMLLAPGAFEMVSPPELPLTIAPGAEVQFSVRFVPIRNGVFRTTLEVDGRVIGDGQFGSVTRRLQELYAVLLDEECLA
jgi:hypothetical protein